MLILLIIGLLEPPSYVRAYDRPNDGGGAIVIEWEPVSDTLLKGYEIFRRKAGEEKFRKIAYVGKGRNSFVNSIGIKDGLKYEYAVRSVGIDGSYSELSIPAPPVASYPQWFKKHKINTLLAIAIYLFLLVYFTQAAKGKELFIRRISGLDHLDEAVGRATEMGKPILYVPGISGMSDIATIASINILSPVAKKAAEYDTPIIVPNRDPIVTMVAQEVVKEAYTEAGRPDAFKRENVFFLSDSQFAYAAGVDGIMVRERPATNLFIGMFYAESLILAETGNMTGAIQIAGTDAVAQLPFFIAACDYTIMGEELYAASAYLSRDPKLVGSIKAQDWGKALLMGLVVLGSILSLFNIDLILKFFATI